MATKVSKPKKPSALALQEQVNLLFPNWTGNQFRVALSSAEDAVTESGIPATATPAAFAEICDANLADMQDVINRLLAIQKRLDPKAIKSALLKFRK